MIALSLKGAAFFFKEKGIERTRNEKETRPYI